MQLVVRDARMPVLLLLLFLLLLLLLTMMMIMVMILSVTIHSSVEHSRVAVTVAVAIVAELILCDATLMITTNLKLFVYDRHSPFIRIYAYASRIYYSEERKKRKKNLHACSHRTHISHIPFLYVWFCSFLLCSVLFCSVLLAQCAVVDFVKTALKNEQTSDCVCAFVCMFVCVCGSSNEPRTNTFTLMRE